MTERFDKFIEYSHLDNMGQRIINDNAPEKIKKEAKEVDSAYFQLTGRHMIIVAD